MQPEVNSTTPPPVAPPLPIQQSVPDSPMDDSGPKRFLKPKFIIIGLVLILLVAIVVIFATRSNSTPTTTNNETITPTRTIAPPAQESTKSWSMEIKYDPSDSSYTVEKLSLQNEEYAPSNSNSNSPYTLTILDNNKTPLSSVKVSIATSIIIPDIIKNSSAAAGLENSSITSVIQIPNVPDGQTIVIDNNGSEIINVSFPSDIQARVNSIEDTFGFAENSNSLSAPAENTSPSGWKIGVEPVCENGKVFAKYSYDIPQFSGVIFTYEQTNPVEDLAYLDDNSWQKPVGSIILLSGKGTYMATGNLVNWNPSSGQLRYNGPVGLQKDKPYKGALMLSGDWTCNGDTSRGGCVDGPPPSGEDIENAKVSVDFNTSIQCAADTTVPTSPPQQSGGIQCVPDLKCSSGKDVLQICPLICS